MNNKIEMEENEAQSKGSPQPDIKDLEERIKSLQKSFKEISKKLGEVSKNLEKWGEAKKQDTRLKVAEIKASQTFFSIPSQLFQRDCLFLFWDQENNFEPRLY